MSWTQQVRARMIGRCYQQLSIGKKNVLDVGCGNGIVSHVLVKEFGMDIRGVDILFYLKRNILFKKMEHPNVIPYTDRSFEYVMFNDMLHHCEDIEALLNEGRRVGKNLVIFEDQPGHVQYIIDRVINFFYCPDMPCPLNFKTSAQWQEIFARMGFKCQVLTVRHPWWWPMRHQAFMLTLKTS